ncbi:hypothetical protein Ptr902_13872 [Pyrenophora tritici-repentis]|nr:hypothetical protein Ptr902_13872 [Pyrenophora tritici-repentis]
MRIKSMWHSERRYSSDSSGEDEVPYKTLHKKRGGECDDAQFGVDWEDKKERADSPRTLSLTGKDRGKGKERIRGEKNDRVDGEAGIEDSGDG